MKRIVAKQYEFASRLGQAIFRNVPVWLVASDKVTVKNFDQDEHEHELSGDVIQLLSREIAVSFYTTIAVNQRTLTGDEVYGIQCVLNVKQHELAQLLGVTKGTISKIVRGNMKMKRPETLLCLEVLKNELMQPGYARAKLDHKRENLSESQLEPTYDFKKLPRLAA
jgi:DNA-binding transcriptional regulator YiaG